MPLNIPLMTIPSTIPPQKMRPAQSNVPPTLAEQLGAPAAAGGIAVCFSHPLELTKVRLQLDH